MLTEHPTQEIVPHGQRTLDEIAVAIQHEHVEIKAHLATALVRAIVLGDLLLEARPQVPKGYFMEWVRDVAKIPQGTANTCMRLAEFKHLLPTEMTEPKVHLGRNRAVSIEQALAYLKPLGVNRHGRAGRRPADKNEIRRLHSQGVPVREIAEMLGVNQKTVYRYTNDPEKEKARRAELRKRQIEAKRILRREKARQELAATSDDLGRAYAAVREALERIQLALPHTTGKRRISVESAMHKLYEAEDRLTRASKEPD